MYTACLACVPAFKDNLRSTAAAASAAATLFTAAAAFTIFAASAASAIFTVMIIMMAFTVMMTFTVMVAVNACGFQLTSQICINCCICITLSAGDYFDSCCCQSILGAGSKAAADKLLNTLICQIARQ